MTAPPRQANPWWLYGFLLVQFACQSGLIFSPFGAVRQGLRVFTFVSSLVMLVAVLGRGARYPLQPLVLAVIGVTALGLFNPGINSTESALAQVVLTACVWAPVFWVGRIGVTPDVFRRVILLMWGFHALSALVGVLQVYDPNRFAPDPQFVRQTYGDYVEGMRIELDNGESIFRPFGLTDSPGGAATSGSFAALAGALLACSRVNVLLRLAGVMSVGVGMFCLYLCQIRASIIVTGIGLLGMVGLMVVRGRADKAIGLGWVIGLAVVGGFVWATSIGSEAVTRRLETLIEDDPGKVYYANRGMFLEYTLDTALPEYPLGAGVGRWGMMQLYFGDPTNLADPRLHAEIQPTGWVYDGGLILLLLGYAALVGACWLAVRTAVQVPDESLAEGAAVVAAFSIGVFASSFGYTVFVSQTGMMFWVLNAALFAATVARPVTPAPRPPARSS